MDRSREEGITTTPRDPYGDYRSKGQRTPPTRLARMVRYILRTLALLFAGFVGLAVWTDSRWGREYLRRSVQATSFQVLAHAKSPEELEEAVGSLGAVLHVSDGSWIAVRYWDSHSGGILSSSVARDSEGRWFVSSHHFCGKLEGYRLEKKKLATTKTDPYFFDCVYADLIAIENADRLDDARELLLGLGFTEVDPPADDERP